MSGYFKVQHVTKEQGSCKGTMDRFRMMYDEINATRSTVIDRALDLENLLTVAILHYLVGRDYEQHKKLRTLVFEAEFCTFMQQRKMLSLIFDLSGDRMDSLTEPEAKELRRNLNKIVEVRNIFAHGQIFVDGRTESVVISHYQNGPKETPVSAAFVKEFLGLCDHTEELLRRLNDQLRDRELA